MRKNIARVLLMALTLSAISSMQDAEAASKITLSNKSLSMKVGATKTVKANKAVKWKTSNKKIATVKKLSTKKAKITAKKAGSCKITATAGKKKATICVKVKKVDKPTKKPTVTVIPTSTPKVTVTPVCTSTVEPAATTVVPTPSTNPAIVASAEPTATAVATTEPTATVAPTVEPTATTVVTSAEPTTTPAATPITVSNSGISMTLDHYENGILTYTIENQTGDTIWYNSYEYSIYKEIGGKWVYLRPDTSLSVPCVIESLENGEKESYTLDLLWEYDLTTGNYRFDMGFGSDIRLSLPFEITNTNITPVIVSQAGISVVFDNCENGALTYKIINQTGKDIRYSYSAIEEEINNTWAMLSLYVERSENTDGQVEKNMTKKNTIQFGVNEGIYRWWITFTLEGDEEADTQQITFKIPFEVE